MASLHFADSTLESRRRVTQGNQHRKPDERIRHGCELSGDDDVDKGAVRVGRGDGEICDRSLCTSR